MAIDQKKKRRCIQMFKAGFPAREISEETTVPLSTIYGWIKREKWDQVAPVQTAEKRLELLITKNGKTAGERREIQTLTNVIGQLKKIYA